MIHTEPHPFAGQTVTVTLPLQSPDPEEQFLGQFQFQVEDWWDRVYGQSWKTAKGNPAALGYAMRIGMAPAAGNPVPPDDEVIYGKIDGRGYLVHVQELDVPVTDPTAPTTDSEDEQS